MLVALGKDDGKEVGAGGGGGLLGENCGERGGGTVKKRKGLWGKGCGDWE